MATAEIVHYPEDMGALSLYRSPEKAIDDARQCAVALKQVMAAKPNPVFFPDGKGGKEQYLEAEDWQLVAAFYSTTAKVIATDYVDYGPAGKGFKATAGLVDRNGVEISRAEAMCLDTEENWGMVTEYEWRDRLDGAGNKIWNARAREGKGAWEREKVPIGEKPKPLFQLLSMAQTRAISKVIGTKFRFVAVLGGFAKTPAEEMTGKEGSDYNNEAPPSAPPQNAQEPSIRPRSEKGATQPPPQAQTPQGGPAAPPQPANGGEARNGGEVLITEKQARMLFAIQRSAGLNDEQCKAALAKLGYTGHRDHLPKRLFQDALNAIDPECRFHTNTF